MTGRTVLSFVDFLPAVRCDPHVGRAFQPDSPGLSGWKARLSRPVGLESPTYFLAGVIQALSAPFPKELRPQTAAPGRVVGAFFLHDPAPGLVGPNRQEDAGLDGLVDAS